MNFCVKFLKISRIFDKILNKKTLKQIKIVNKKDIRGVLSPKFGF